MGGFMSLFSTGYWKGHDGYWEGPYGILVPNEIGAVCAADGGNTLYKNGIVTEIGISSPMSKEKYFNTYAEKRNDGNWYYKKPTL